MSLARLLAASAAAIAFGGILAAGAPALPIPAAAQSSAALPTITLTQQPSATTPATTATFAWTSQGATTTTCAGAGQPAHTCTSPTTLTGLSPGAYTFAVRVVNASGSAHAVVTWTVIAATSAPPPAGSSVTITSGPGATTTSSSASFSISAANASSLACSIDNGVPAPCSTPASYSGIAPGAHMFTVTATSGSLSTSASYPWTVTPPPTVTILSGPASTTSSTSAAFSFVAANATSLNCAVDKAAPAPCSAPASFTGLAPGAHVFTVTASSGSLSTNASYSWTVTVPPTVTIVSQPASTTSTTSAGFSFATTNSTSITCSLDAAAPAPCTTSAAYANLSIGTHVFTVVAVGGGVSAAASFSLTITPPPATAKLWISATGSDSTCVRSSSPVDYATALKNGNVCATGPVAYQRASLGDTILTQTMTVSSQWAFGRTITKSVPNGTCDYNYGGTANLSNCITIEPAPGQSIRFSVAGNNQPQIRVCVSGLSIQNLTIQDTTFTDGFGDAVSNAALVQGSGDNTCGTSAPHDDYYVNVTFGGPLDILGGSYNTWVVGGTQTGTHEMSSQFAGLGNNGAIPAMHGSGEVGITWEGYNFINLDPGHHHAECVHVDGSESNEVFAGNRFEQCPVESLFFETESGSQTGNLIENNYFDPGNGGGPFKFACRQPGCVESNNIIRFNSFAGPWQIACEASSGAC